MSWRLPTAFLKKFRDSLLRRNSDSRKTEGPGGLFRRLEEAIRRAPLVPVTVTGMIGIVMADRSGWVTLGLCLAFLLALIALLTRRSQPLVRIGIAAALVMGVLAAKQASELRKIHSFPFAAAMEEGHAIEIRGSGWIASEPREGNRSSSGIVHLGSVMIEDHEIPCDHRVPFRAFRTNVSLAYGSEIEFEGRLLPLDSARSPGGFDPAAFYYRQSGSLARLEIGPGDDLLVRDRVRSPSILALANQLQSRFEETLQSGISPQREPYARLIAAMSLGAREDSPEDLEVFFRESGTMHLFAVSGLHVGVVAGLILGTLLLFRIPRRYAVLITIPLVLFYAVLTGLRPSAVRAAIMLSVFLLGFAVKEKPRLLNSLALAALLILFVQPGQLFLPGFQLSFAVLLGIALFAEPLRERISQPWITDPFVPKTFRSPLRRFKDHAVVALSAAFAVSLVSWFGSSGLLAWHFQSLSPVGIVANVFLVPFAGIIVSLALGSVTTAGLHLPWIPEILNRINVAIAITLTAGAQFFSNLPGAHRHVGPVGGSAPDPSALVLDIMGEYGEGAILASIPASRGNSSRWMIDSGGTKTYQRSLLPTLRYRSVNQVDGLVLTHGDAGHIGAVPDVLQQFRPALLLESTAGNKAAVYPEIVEMTERQGLRQVKVEAGSRIEIGEGVRLRIVHPGPDTTASLADDRVLVFQLEYRDWRLLFTSDAGFETEKSLLEAGVDLESDVWIRGQHASAPSGLANFVSRVQPRVVISSSSMFPAGERISDSLKKQVTELGARLITLDEIGVVTVEVSSDRLSFHAWGPRRELFSIPAEASSVHAEGEAKRN